MIANVALFALAAFFEIAGCFAFWVWLRRGGTPVVALVGIASLIAFALALTPAWIRVRRGEAQHTGGIYIAASLVWLWLIEGQAPTRTHMIGAALAIAGALIIIGFAARVR